MGRRRTPRVPSRRSRPISAPATASSRAHGVASPGAPGQAPAHAPQQRRPEPVAEKRPPRDPWFDNAKMLLVTLVVVGHSWTLLPSSWFHSSAYDFLYLWHVPAFVMVTGYLSRRFSWTSRDLRRLVSTVAVPYVLFEGLLALFRTTVGGEHLELVWINPHWPMWYLSVLFLWRLATPALRRLRHPFAVSVAVSLAGGWVGVDALDVDRALGLLPFFVLGVLAEQRHLDLLRSSPARLLGVVSLGVALVAAYVLGGRIENEWLYFRTPYGDMGSDWVTGPLVRLAVIGVATALALSFLSLVPTRRSRISALGAASLVVYLCHGFVVLAAEYAGFPGWAAAHPVVSWPLATFAAVLVAVGLAWRPVAHRLDKVVTPVR